MATRSEFVSTSCLCPAFPLIPVILFFVMSSHAWYKFHNKTKGLYLWEVFLKQVCIFVILHKKIFILAHFTLFWFTDDGNIVSR